MDNLFQNKLISLKNQKQIIKYRIIIYGINISFKSKNNLYLIY